MTPDEILLAYLRRHPQPRSGRELRRALSKHFRRQMQLTLALYKLLMRGLVHRKSIGTGNGRQVWYWAAAGIPIDVQPTRKCRPKLTARDKTVKLLKYMTRHSGLRSVEILTNMRRVFKTVAEVDRALVVLRREKKMTRVRGWDFRYNRWSLVEK